jgi:protein OS-9
MNQQNSRYLVQHWKDGTKCDKSGKPREVEVQVHCDMTSTDMIYLIKEMAICQYVLVIHSPHLCSLPGFKPRHVDVDIAGIQCRQVIDDADFDKWIQSKQDEAESRTHFDGFKRLPWKVEKKVPEHPGLAGFGIDNTMFQAVKPQVEAKDNSLPEIDDDSLQLVLQQALKALNDQLQRGGKGQSEDDEMVVLSLEEDDEGRLYLDGQVLKGSQEEAETQAEEDTGTTGSIKRESVAQAVQQYLESRQRQKELESEQDGDADRKHDEL